MLSDLRLAPIRIAEQLLQQRQLTEASAAFDAAEAIGLEKDRCAAGRWTAAMLRGDFEAAWHESDAIRERGGPDRHRFWMGEKLDGKVVIVRCLHGFGDAIQLLRYLPELNSVAKHVVLEVAPRFLSLAPTLEGVDDVVTWGAEAPAAPRAWDVQVEIMELPYIFRTTEAELPVRTNYLRVPEEDQKRAAKVMGNPVKPRVGLVWAAGEWNRDRSISPNLLDPLLQSGSAEFWCLQGGEAAKDAAAWIKSGRMRDASACGDGLRALAGAIANLDLIITVDTLAAHMAGAMGKPVWVLLQHEADWRWMTEREDSPWYPTAKLFRQENRGEWKAVLRRVEMSLRSKEWTRLWK